MWFLCFVVEIGGGMCVEGGIWCERVDFDVIFNFKSDNVGSGVLNVGRWCGNFFFGFVINGGGWGN